MIRVQLARILTIIFVVPVFVAIALFSAGCDGEKASDILAAKDYTGHLLITSVTTDPATGPGIASLFNPAGELAQIVADYMAGGTTYASAVALRPPNLAYLVVEPSERVDLISLDSGDTVGTYSNSNMTANPFRQMAYSAYDGSIFVTESNINSIEKFLQIGNALAIHLYLLV